MLIVVFKPIDFLQELNLFWVHLLFLIFFLSSILQNFSNTSGSDGRKLEGFFLVLDNVEICLTTAKLCKADSSSSVIDTRTSRSGNLEAGIVRNGSIEVVNQPS